jgi:hypothetical protein
MVMDYRNPEVHRKEVAKLLSYDVDRIYERLNETLRMHGRKSANYQLPESSLTIADIRELSGVLTTLVRAQAYPNAEKQVTQ